jgi:hypothetical protein
VTQCGKREEKKVKIGNNLFFRGSHKTKQHHQMKAQKNFIASYGFHVDYDNDDSVMLNEATSD